MNQAIIHRMRMRILLLLALLGIVFPPIFSCVGTKNFNIIITVVLSHTLSYAVGYGGFGLFLLGRSVSPEASSLTFRLLTLIFGSVGITLGTYGLVQLIFGAPYTPESLAPQIDRIAANVFLVVIIINVPLLLGTFLYHFLGRRTS